MADLETRLHDALGDAGSHTPPSPDLFARVVGSIADDRARRRRVRTIALAVGRRRGRRSPCSLSP